MVCHVLSELASCKKPLAILNILDAGASSRPQSDRYADHTKDETCNKCTRCCAGITTLRVFRIALSPLYIGPDASTLINTNPGIVIGTAQYMSPEQARELPLDARTDIFSMGVVLYEMVAGHRPFEGETISEVIVSILERKPPAQDSNRSPQAFPNHDVVPSLSILLRLSG